MKKILLLIFCITIFGCSNNNEPFETIEINGQVWTKNNLAIRVSTEGGTKCLTCDKYGYLYTYNGALEVESMYPGWRLPTKAETQRLVNHYNGNYAKFVKEFNCIGGICYPKDNERKMKFSGFWTSTESKKNKIFIFGANKNNVSFDDLDKNYYVSLRLIKEQ